LFDDECAVHRFVYTDTETGVAPEELGHTRLIFVELPKFDVDWSQVNTDLDKWIAFFKEGETLTSANLPAALQGDPALVKAVTTLERMGADPALRVIWEKQEAKRLADIKEIEFAARKARSEGIAEGKAEGIAEGAVREARNMLLLFGKGRLGQPSEGVVRRLEAIDTVAALETLVPKILAVESWDELLA